jgi:hypothetical protein
VKRPSFLPSFGPVPFMYGSLPAWGFSSTTLDATGSISAARDATSPGANFIGLPDLLRSESPPPGCDLSSSVTVFTLYACAA